MDTPTLDSVIVPVTDLAAAKAVFSTALGAEPDHDAPYYVGYRVGAVQIGLDPHGHAQGMTGPLPYVRVPDLEAAVASLVAAGATAGRPPTQVGGGARTATVTDADGNVVGLVERP